MYVETLTNGLLVRYAQVAQVNPYGIIAASESTRFSTHRSAGTPNHLEIARPERGRVFRAHAWKHGPGARLTLKLSPEPHRN